MYSIKIFLAVNALIFAIGAGAVYRRISRFEAAKREVERFGGDVFATPIIPGAVPHWVRWEWKQKFYSEFLVVGLHETPEVNRKSSDESLVQFSGSTILGICSASHRP